MKNKRQFAFCTKRTVFVALFLVGLLVISAIMTFALNVSAQLAPVASVNIASAHLNFENGDPGAWKVKKSAEWTAVGKAKITLDVETIPKVDSSKKLDIIMAIDTSGSMSGEKMAQVKTDATDLVNSLLSDPSNKVALITFDSDATILSGLTNEKTTILDLISNISVGGTTNYYDGLLKAEEILESYTHQTSRDVIILFLTDGYPNVSTPNEVAEYHAIKAAYPYVVVNGIQYEMGDTVLQPIIDVSDNQFIANRNSLNIVLFEATVIPYVYEDFVITDFIDDTYWTVAGIEAIEASLGETGLSYDGSTPKITWDMSGLLRSGGSARLTIEIDLKSEFINQEDLLLPTNKHETIKTDMPEVPEEDIDSPATPVLKDIYDVIYDANAPAGCEPTGTIPETTSHTIFSTVEMSDSVLSCSNYSFKGWRFDTEGIKWINDDYFQMPGKDVHIVAVWTKPSISKSMDGTTHTHATATFASGQNFIAAIKKLSGQTSATYSTINTTITAFRRSDSLPQSVDTNNGDNLLSYFYSQLPIYGWYNDGVIYYYTDADDIYLHESAQQMFQNLQALTDISGLSYVNTSNVKTIYSIFNGDIALTNVDALSNWDVSKVTSFINAFYGATSLTNLDGVADWNTSSVKSMSGTFENVENLTNIDALEKWNTSSVTSMSFMFYGDTSLENIDGAIRWNTSNVIDMHDMFYNNVALSDVSGASDWVLTSATDMSYMFYHTDSLTDLDDLAGWRLPNVTNTSFMFNFSGITNIDGALDWGLGSDKYMHYMFSASKITNIDGAIRWNTSNVIDMHDMFYNTTTLTDISGAINWQTSNVKNMSSMFNNANSLQTIDGAENWNVSSVTDMGQMFDEARSLTDIDAMLNWNVSSVQKMNRMFGRTSITNIDALRNWDTSSVTTMGSMFYYTKLENIDGAGGCFTNDQGEKECIVREDGTRGWNTSSVTTMSGMFANTAELQNVDGAYYWDTSSVTKMSSMFAECDKLNNLDGVENWNTANVTDMSQMFMYDKLLENIDKLHGWNVSSVTTFRNMFSNDTSLKNIDGALNWTTTSLTETTNMFTGTRNLMNINGAANWDMSHVTSLYGMFSFNYELSDISGLRNWTVTSVTSMASMFFSSSKIPNTNDFASWVTTSLTDTSQMFYSSNGLTDVCGLSGFDMSNVTTVSNMFNGDRNITNLTCLDSWAVPATADMTKTFYYVPESITRPQWYHE